MALAWMDTAKLDVGSTLANQLPAALAYVQASRGDGLALVPPVRIYTSEKTTLEGFPAIELVGGGSEPDDSSGAVLYLHTIDIIWTVMQDDEERAALQLERSLLATVLVLQAEQWDAVIAPLDRQASLPGRVDYLLVERESNAFTKSGRVIARVRTAGALWRR